MLENLPQPPTSSGPLSPPPLPVKEEITSLDLTPKSGKSKKFKVVLIVTALFFLFASVPTAVYLVRQRELGQEAKGEVCQPGQFKDQCEGQCVVNDRIREKKVTYQCVDGNWQKTAMENCDPMYCSDLGPAPNGPTPREGDDCECSGVNDQDSACISKYGAGKSPHCDGCKCVGGDCGGDSDCAQWEVCKNGSCLSKEGCARDSDCLSGKCIGGYCSGAGQVECYADETGVRVVNNTGGSITGNIDGYSSFCSGLDGKGKQTCGCAGSGFSVLSVSLANGATWSRGIAGQGPPNQCAWQSDINFRGAVGCHNADSGCVAGCGGVTSTPTPTGRPTPSVTPTYNIACEFCRVYDSSWNRIIDFATITVGQTVYFATSGTTTQAQGITKARFRINGGVWQETTNTHEGKYYIQYTIPSATTYTIESMIYNPTLGWY